MLISDGSNDNSSADTQDASDVMFFEGKVYRREDGFGRPIKNPKPQEKMVIFA